MLFVLHNVGTVPFEVVPSLDASDVGWRYPKIGIDIEHDGEPVTVETWGRCGMMNPLTADDLRTLPPGESLNPFGPGSFGHERLRWTPTEPGEYRVRLRYDFGEHSDWLQAEPMLQAQLTTAPSGQYASPWVSVTET